jgi:hypothetical protein
MRTASPTAQLNALEEGVGAENLIVRHYDAAKGSKPTLSKPQALLG